MIKKTNRLIPLNAPGRKSQAEKNTSISGYLRIIKLSNCSCKVYLFLMCRGHMCAGRETWKCLCERRQLRLQKENKMFKWGRVKAPGRANSHEIPDASCQCGDRPRQLPKSRASPHSSKAGGVGGGGGGGGGGTAKASPNVKWHLLKTRRGGRFHASVPGDLCGPSRSAKPRAAVLASSSSFWRRSRFPIIPSQARSESQVHLASKQNVW